MSKNLFRRLERFRKRENLSILALCKQLETSNVNYHRWKKANQIVGPYKKIIEDYLNRHENPQSLQQSSYQATSDIAVIGLACYYPGASNVPELWQNILARRIQFRRMLDQRLPLSDYYDSDPKVPDKTYLTKAAFIENFNFDWGKLRIPKKTIESTDIAHWLALDTALKTFEDAGFKLKEIPLQNTGVIVGNTLTGEQTRSQTLRLRWPYVQKILNATLKDKGMSLEERTQIAAEMEQIYKSAFYPVTEDSLAGGLANTIAGRICNYLNLKGGGYLVDGACSSSLLAIATAANALRMGEMDLALAGGVDISLDPFELVGFAKAGALARDKMSVYDQSANGFLPGEGCGFVLLKRLADAIKDKNYIYGVIKGWGISSDGKGGIMEPSSSGQSFAIGRAYKNLDYKIADVDFVEGHGTGTTKGDRVELEGIATAIELTVAKDKKYLRTCGVTSFKSIVGHTKAAAGVGGFIKAILAVNQRILPPTASCTNPNQVFQDKAKNMYPLIQGEVLSPTRIARAGISSAGFGGINCHVTVESHDEPKENLKPKINERALFVSQQQSEVFVFSARSLAYLKKIIGRFKEDLRNVSIAEMADLSALLNKKVKSSFPVKVAIVTETPEHLYDALLILEHEISSSHFEEGKAQKIKAKDINTHILISINAKKGRLGFLYPGQGSQRLNMTRVLVERYKWAQDLFHLSRLPLYEYIYKPIDKFLTKEEQQEFEKQLTDTRITQPAITLSSLIWTEFLDKLGIEPDSVAGHSLGELAALYKASALNKVDLVRFSELRGQLMAAKGRPGSMVSLICSKHKAEELIGKISGNIVLANINSPSQIIVSGGFNEIAKVIELAQKETISTNRLNVSNAFHSSLMMEASKKIQNTKILPEGNRKVDIAFNFSTGSLKAGDRINLREYLSKQVISPVDFIEIVEVISKDCDLLLEVGPGRVLSDLVKSINKGQGPLCFPIESSAQNDRDLNIMLAEIFVRNIPIKWDELYKNRLIKVFVPASRKKFVENQCEHPLKIGNQVIKTETLVVSSPSSAVLTSNEEIIPGESQENVTGKDSIAELLINLTHEITGFEKETITLNLRLLDDLNLDSIKAGELIGKAARSLRITGKVDPSQISHNTLGEIRDRLHDLVDEYKISGNKEESKEDVFNRYKGKPWVRNFVLKLRHEEINSKNINQFKDLKNVLILSENEEDDLANALKEKFRQSKVKKAHYLDEIKVDSSLQCIISILPKGLDQASLNKELLKEIIKRFNKIVELASSSKVDKNAFIVFVQFGGGNFGENQDLKNIASSSAKSLGSTLYLERPDLKIKIVDFNNKSSNKDVATRIIDELQTNERFNAIGYDAKFRRSVIFYDVSQTAEYKKRNISWSSKDIVLVTGGAKGITAQCALEFAKSTHARMVLVGSSPVPKDKDDQANEINQTLKLFVKNKLKAVYYSCDVTNENNVNRVIKDIQTKEGKITGFIHGAGLNSLKRLKQVGITEAFNETLPKVIGAVNVCNALSKEPPKLISAITSIIGITGMDGSGWYGLANEILNLYLHQFKTKHNNTEIASIAYSVWDEVGMGAKLGSVDRLAQKGIGSISVQEGVKRFVQLSLNNSGSQQTIIAARVAGIETWKLPIVKSNNFRFIEKVEYFQPGVELIAKAYLNIMEDPYLLDHNWKGTLLFPFVFGFEAMVQAVGVLLGINKFESIIGKAINLKKPIAVSDTTGTNIEIHALVLETINTNEPKRIKVEIYCEETGYRDPHFSAIFEVNIDKKKIISNLMEKSGKVVDIDLKNDIYGPILFQGNLFQNIKEINELKWDGNKGECVFSSTYNKSTEVFLEQNKKFNKHFLVGDPFFIDSLLQSMQIIVSQNSCLPNYIGEILISKFEGRNKKDILAKTYVHKISKDELIGEAIIGNDECSLAIKDCRLRILESHPERPTANDIANSTTRDQELINKRLLEISRLIKCDVPIIKCSYFTGLEKLDKSSRHEVEVPFISSTINEALLKNIQNKIKIKDSDIKWLPTGKPVINKEVINGLGISLSHNNNLVICIAGEDEQGCDIELIEDRDWIAMIDKRYHHSFEKLLHILGDRSYAGTAIWSALEVLKKVGSNKIDFEIADILGEIVIFKDLSSENGFIITTPIKLTTFKSRIISYYQRISNYSVKSTGRSKNTEKELFLRKFGFKEEDFAIQVDYSGPQEQYVFTKHFPVTFKTNKLMSRRVYFSIYFDWMGELREYSIAPIMGKLAEMFETGGWGLATNSVNLQILGDLRGNDIVVGRVWMEEVSGAKENIFDLCFEWRKKINFEKFERVGICKQRTSWIKIIGHGQGVIEELPEAIKKFMDLMKPRVNKIIKIDNILEPFTKLSIGKEIRNFKQKLLLMEHSFDTTLENSNLVGNVYFANYAKWIGIIEDLYFYKLIPESYRGTAENGEFICTNCEVDHLSEAMPFDKVYLKMYVTKIYQYSLDLDFEFYLNVNGKLGRKLAVARQKLKWVKRKGNEIYTDHLPAQILGKLKT